MPWWGWLLAGTGAVAVVGGLIWLLWAGAKRAVGRLGAGFRRY